MDIRNRRLVIINMNTEIVLRNLGLANQANIIGLIRAREPLKFLISDDNVDLFFSVLTHRSDVMDDRCRRQILSSLTAAFKKPTFRPYRNFMGKLVATANTPLNMMYGPCYTIQAGASIPIARGKFLTAAKTMQANGNIHFELLGASTQIYQVVLTPNTDGSHLSITVDKHVDDAVTVVDNTMNISKTKQSDLYNLAHALNKGTNVNEDQALLLQSFFKLNLTTHAPIDVQPIDFDAPVFPQPVLDIFRKYDDVFDDMIGSKSKGEIMENTHMFVARIMAILSQEPDMIFDLTGNQYIINDVAKIEPLVSHVLSEMPNISSTFFE
jgi:hypothetical protein